MSLENGKRQVFPDVQFFCVVLVLNHATTDI